MDVTYHVADALTGTIVPGLTLSLVDVALTHRFTGGAFTGTLGLHANLDLVNQWNFEYFRQLLPHLEPGAASIVALNGRTVLGEWAIWKQEIDDISGEMVLSGFEWHGYPAMRALERDYVYKGWDMGQVLYEMLLDCFRTRQDFKIAIPKRDLGFKVTMDHKKKTAYYGDLLDELSETAPGFEWFVNSQVEWSGGSPVRVVREVIISKGRFLNAQPVQLEGPTPGSPGGALLSWKRTRDASKSAASVFAFGKGQGEKQIVSDAINYGLLDGKHVITTKYDTHSDVEDQARLDALARSAADLAATLDEPVRAQIDLAGTPTYPSLGDAFTVVLYPRPSIPGSMTRRYRVGETTIRPDRSRAVMDVLMEPM